MAENKKKYLLLDEIDFEVARCVMWIAFCNFILRRKPRNLGIFIIAIFFAILLLVILLTTTPARAYDIDALVGEWIEETLRNSEVT